MDAGQRALDHAAAAFAQAAIGGALPPDLEAMINEAGRLRHSPGQALELLRRARAAAPRHPAPLIAQYRFHFYNLQLVEARAVGEDAMVIARSALGTEFGDVPPSREATRFDAAVRFYLFTLKGLAYLNLRLGEAEEARTLLEELRRLDPEDQIGGGLLLQVLLRHMLRPADDDIEAPPGYAGRGWT